MNSSYDLFTLWQFDAVTTAALALLLVSYLLLRRYGVKFYDGAFAAAFVLLVLCLLSPLQLLSSHYLFSAHMTVHVLLLLVVAPLLVLSLPTRLPQPVFRFFDFFYQRPWLAWFCGVGVMWFWHVPPVFNSMMRHDNVFFHQAVHHVETFSLVLSGMIFSYPVLRRDGLRALVGVVYLASACAFCSLLGLMIAFAPTGLYYHYLASYDPYNINQLIQQRLQLTQHDDQQAAGLIMWVPCCFVYLSGALYLVKRWFDQTDAAVATKPQA